MIAAPGSSMNIADIDQRIAKLNEEFQELFAASREEGGYLKYAGDFKRITDAVADLKEKRSRLLEQQNSDSASSRRIQDAINILNTGSAEIAEWDESIVRQLVDTVKVLSADRINVRLQGGVEIEQAIGEDW